MVIAGTRINEKYLQITNGSVSMKINLAVKDEHLRKAIPLIHL